MPPRHWFFLLLALPTAAACPGSPAPSEVDSNPFTPDRHRFFPISPGTSHALGRDLEQGPLACESCHPPGASSFREFDCLGCHTHDRRVTDALHPTVPDYAYSSRRCQTCHPSEEKVPYDHAGLTLGCAVCHDVGAPFASLPLAGFTHPPMGKSDCGACHALPGGGTALAPDWRGARASVPAVLSVGGFTIPSPPAPTPGPQPGPTNLPHPAGDVCTSCHASAAGGRQAFGYDHQGPLGKGSCGACHEAGSDLVGTAWNGATEASAGAGDTRPFTLRSVTASTYKASTRPLPSTNHFFPVDCYECHVVPTGVARTSTGPAFTDAWKFPHPVTQMTLPGTCRLCHDNI